MGITPCHLLLGENSIHIYMDTVTNELTSNKNGRQTGHNGKTTIDVQGVTNFWMDPRNSNHRQRQWTHTF